MPSDQKGPHNNQDFLMKYIVDFYLKVFLTILGMEDQGLQPIGNDFITLEPFETISDRVFCRPDGSTVIIEFDSTGRKDSLNRYLQYAMVQSLAHYKRKECFLPVTIIVLYSSGVLIPELDPRFVGCDLFQWRLLSWADYVDGDNLLEGLRKTFSTGPNPLLDKENVVKLSLAVLGQEEKKRQQFFEDCLDLVKPYRNDPAVKASNLLPMMSLAALHAMPWCQVAEELQEFDVDELYEMMDVISRGEVSSRIARAELKAEAEAEVAVLKAKADAEIAVLKAKAEKAEAEIAELRAEYAALKA
jgi:hypothetical protein